MHNTIRHPDTVALARICSELFHNASVAVHDWALRRRTRRHLHELDARTLADVGITEDQRRHECAKPFWER